jgi:hypothetical protein
MLLSGHMIRVAASRAALIPISRWLWRALETPPSPYWGKLVTDPDVNRYTYSPWAYLTVALLVLSVGVVGLLNGLLWGMYVAANTAQALTHERKQAMFDTLAITPLGAGGVAWRLLASVLHYEIGLVHFLGLRKLVIAVLVLPLALLLSLLALVMAFDSTAVSLPKFCLLMCAVALIPVAYLDPIYGLLTGGLVALLASQRTRSDAALQAVVITLALQVVGYLIPAVAGGLVFSGIGLLPERVGWLAALTLPVWIGGTFAAVHEGMLTGLYWKAGWHEDSPPA